MKTVELSPQEQNIPDHLIQNGIQVFGSRQLFMTWLNGLNKALGDVKPVELIRDRQGLALVEDALGALEYGNLM